VTSRFEEGAEQAKARPGGDVMKDLHADRLLEEVQKLVTAMGTRAATSLLGKVDGAAGRLTDYAENGGSGLLSAVTGSSPGKGGSGLLSSLAGAAGLGGSGGEDGGSSLKDRLAPGFNAVKAFAKTKVEQKLKKGGKGGKGKKLKITNIVETLDVGVPLRLAYDQWTQFEEFPSFMKKVESVEQASDEKLNWKAQVFWSHRTWESTIVEQIPDTRIVWRSKGPKGWVDGAVTFHELAPELTRIVLVLEYHPQGLFERTGNIWRAQGRRVRLEFKHFRRHVMTQSVLRPDELEGWRGEIRDGEVVKDHETALREEQEAEGAPEREEAEGRGPETGPEEEERPGEAGDYGEEEGYEEEEPEEGEYDEEPEGDYDEYEEEQDEGGKPGGRYEEEDEEGEEEAEPRERETAGRRGRERRSTREASRPERAPRRSASRTARTRHS
jgi:uncharacterized membrane protein